VARGSGSQRFHQHPDQLTEAFAEAWYKLLHLDMGPVSRYLGLAVGLGAPCQPESRAGIRHLVGRLRAGGGHRFSCDEGRGEDAAVA
jgi:hypothetical protein